MLQKKKHPSDSQAQRNAEGTLLIELSKVFGFSVRGERIGIGDGRHIHVDGINRDHRLICEIFSRIGTLQSAQIEKVASDILKLTFLELTLGGTWRKVMCFADDSAANVLRNRSWLAAAAKSVHIEVVVAKLPANVHLAVLTAQAQQTMVNKSSNAE